MKKSNQLVIGLASLIIGTLLLGADRLFVSASAATYSQSVTVLTTVSLFFFLVGVVVFFRVIYKSK
ncbi:MAG: hypothetical protein WCV58_02145 [Patescibacteria group bacterium]|jgi:TM2 domain-containing membrane protein YozV